MHENQNIFLNYSGLYVLLFHSHYGLFKVDAMIGYNPEKRLKHVIAYINQYTIYSEEIERKRGRERGREKGKEKISSS